MRTRKKPKEENESSAQGPALFASYDIQPVWRELHSPPIDGGSGRRGWIESKEGGRDRKQRKIRAVNESCIRGLSLIASFDTQPAWWGLHSSPPPKTPEGA